MATQSAPLRRFTVDDFERMGESGILRQDDRVELIEGQIVELSPIGKRHRTAVNSAGPNSRRWSFRTCACAGTI
jgi:hypothetical protein